MKKLIFFASLTTALATISGCTKPELSKNETLSRQICELNTFGAQNALACACKMAIVGDEFGTEKLDQLLQRLKAEHGMNAEYFLIEMAVADPDAAKQASTRNAEECHQS
tara:strand:- start:334254 stop:334583 length:330 start_codon:yes stop_codon:yes gene_type:complete